MQKISLIEEIKELKKAKEKFPWWPNNNVIHAAAIVAEESGELIRAALHILEKKGPVLEPLVASSFFERAKDINVSEALSIPLKIL